MMTEYILNKFLKTAEKQAQGGPEIEPMDHTKLRQDRSERVTLCGLIVDDPDELTMAGELKADIARLDSALEIYEEKAKIGAQEPARR